MYIHRHAVSGLAGLIDDVVVRVVFVWACFLGLGPVKGRIETLDGY
jgi:hypothetical protein